MKKASEYLRNAFGTNASVRPLKRKEESAVNKDVGNEQAKGPDLKDKQGKQSDLVDRRHGAYDDVGRSDDGVPEGLRREPKHPINPHGGRGGMPSHVPGRRPGQD